MIYLVTGIDMALAAAFWLTLALGCFILYRAFHLRVLPWIGSYFVVSFASANLMYVYAHHFVQSSGLPVDPHSGVTVAAMVASIIEHSGNLLAVVLALAEVAVLGARGQAGVVAPGLRWFARIHAYTRPLGITLLILGLVFAVTDHHLLLHTLIAKRLTPVKGVKRGCECELVSSGLRLG